MTRSFHKAELCNLVIEDRYRYDAMRKTEFQLGAARQGRRARKRKVLLALAAEADDVLFLRRLKRFKRAANDVCRLEIRDNDSF